MPERGSALGENPHPEGAGETPFALVAVPKTHGDVSLDARDSMNIFRVKVVAFQPNVSNYDIQTRLPLTYLPNIL
jgi:hypothetical protein